MAPYMISPEPLYHTLLYDLSEVLKTVQGERLQKKSPARHMTKGLSAYQSRIKNFYLGDPCCDFGAGGSNERSVFNRHSEVL